MPRVFIPPLMRSLTGGVEEIDVPGTNVGEVVDALESRFPGVRGRLCNDSDLKPGICVTVDGNVSSLGLLHKVDRDSEIHFLPAVGGG